MHNQREVGSWCIHAEIKQALGDIQSRNAALLLLTLCRGDELVLAHQGIGDRIVGRQFVSQIIGIEDSAL